MRSPAFTRRSYAELANLSAGYSPLHGKIPKHYSPVRRSSACIATPVTDRLACVKHAASVQSEPGSNSSLEDFEIIKQEWIQNGSNYFTCWTFWSLGHHAQRHSTRVPTQITCQTFKEHSGPLGVESRAVHAWACPAKGGGSIATGYIPSTFVFSTNFPTRTVNRSRLRGRAV